MTRLQRLPGLLAALRESRGHVERERWTRERLAAHQQERLDALVRHAVARSPGHRERLAGVVRPGVRVELTDLPVMTKAELMADFDRLVCDPRVRRDEVLAMIERAEGVARTPQGHRAMATSGSSGRKGLFVYDDAGWRGILTQFLRYSDWMGMRPRVPRLRIAAVIGTSPTHMSRQCAHDVDAGVHRVLTLRATAPLGELVDALNAFRPDALNGYPSVLVPLAREQLAGRLRIAPSIVGTSSELRTPEASAVLREAFGVDPFDLYATTEGLWGLECEHHAGHHLFEDHTIVENVDADGRPVPPGVRGAKLLVTNLANRVQPIVRLELADAITIAAEPCPCGRTLARTAAIAGRTTDVLELPGDDGRRVAVVPMQFAVLTRDRAVREFQVRQEPDGLRVLVVAAADDEDLEARLGAALHERLAALGAARVPIRIERRPELARVNGKLPLVVADPGRPPVHV